MGKIYSLFLDEADLEISNERPEFHKYQHIVRARHRGKTLPNISMR